MSSHIPKYCGRQPMIACDRWERMNEEDLIHYLSKDTFIYQRMLSILMDKVDECGDIVEYGCGVGTFYNYIRECAGVHYDAYTGVDATNKVVSIASRFFKEDARCSFYLADVNKGPLAECTVSIGKDLFEHLASHELPLANVLASTQRYALLSFFNVTNGKTNINQVEPYYYFNCLSSNELVKTFSDYGFKVVHNESFPELAEAGHTRVLMTCPELADYQQGFPSIYLLERA